MPSNRIGAGGPFRQPQFGGSDPSNESLSIFIVDYEHETENYSGGVLGFRIDTPPAVEQGFVVDTEQEIELFDYELLLVPQVDAAAAAPTDVEQSFIEGVEHEPADYPDVLLEQYSESDTILVLLDDVAEEVVECIDEVLFQLEYSGEPAEQQLLADAEYELEVYEEFLLAQLVDAAIVAEETNQQFIDEQFEELEIYEDFLFIQLVDAAIAAEEINQQFIDEQFEELEAYEEFLQNLFTEAGAAPDEIEQQFVEDLFYEAETYEEFLTNLLPADAPVFEEIEQQFLDLQFEEEEAYEEFLTNLLPEELAPEEMQKSTGFYGVSYRRRKRREDEDQAQLVDVGVRETINSYINKLEGAKATVSISEQGDDEVVKIQISGISKRDMDVILVAILASEL